MNKIEKKLQKVIYDGLHNLGIEVAQNEIQLDIPKDVNHGDYASNICLRLAKVAKKAPLVLANELLTNLGNNSLIKKVEIAGPGFLNFFIQETELAQVINDILNEKEKFGHNNSGQNQKILLEYISANPTGILHLGHARGAAWGDSLARILKACNYDVLREYYVNDAGVQIKNLVASLKERIKELAGKDFQLPEDGYHGVDVIAIAETIYKKHGQKLFDLSATDLDQLLEEEGVALELERIKTDLAYFNIEMDSWVSEKWLVSGNRIEKVLAKLKEQDLLYQQEDALWFKSTLFGDDKDRVLIKSDGNYTYLLPDITNHLYKIERGYSQLVDLWGADHHGYIPRMKASLAAMGYPNCLEVDIIQMVRLIEDGKEVKMSKRTGNAITIRELIDDIGVDATRYFFVQRALDTHFDFDISLAKSQSVDNPVYYAQYAHARICSILDKQQLELNSLAKYHLLTSQYEKDLLKWLANLENVLSEIATSRNVSRMCQYIQTLASLFHSFYAHCKVMDSDNIELSQQRLLLCMATKQVLKNGLDYIGITALERM